MHRLLALVSIVAMTAAYGGADAAGKIYQWKDRHGVTHYTDRPPAEGEFRDRDIERRQPPAPPTEDPADTTVPENADPLVMQREENCRRARQNLETLRDSGQVRLDRDGDGTPEPLSDAERTHQMEVAAQQVLRYCEG